MTPWLPATALLVTFALRELLRQLGRPARGLVGLLIDLAMAISFVVLVLLLIDGLEIDAAQRALDGARAWLASAPGAVTAALAAAGSLLVCGGAARLVDRVALADPDGPLPHTTAPALAAALGALLLLLAWLRL